MKLDKNLVCIGFFCGKTRICPNHLLKSQLNLEGRKISLAQNPIQTRFLSNSNMKKWKCCG